jgi:hypothetical protein
VEPQAVFVIGVVVFVVGVVVAVFVGGVVVVFVGVVVVVFVVVAVFVGVVSPVDLRHGNGNLSPFRHPADLIELAEPVFLFCFGNIARLTYAPVATSSFFPRKWCHKFKEMKFPFFWLPKIVHIYIE